MNWRTVYDFPNKCLFLLVILLLRDFYKMRVLELGNGLLADKWSELNKLGVKLSLDSFSYTAIFIFPLYIIFKKTSFNSS